MRQRLAPIILVLMSFTLVLSASLWTGSGEAGEAISLSARVSPSTVLIGGKVDYTIVMTQEVGLDSGQPVVKVNLPDGFRYQPGTSEVDGLPVRDPVVDGTKLSYRSLPKLANAYGINTFVQDAMSTANSGKQLDWSLALSGNGGCVKQLLYPITAATAGPKQEWIDFVNSAYDRGLTPILRLQGVYDGANGYWVKPAKDPDGTYTTIAKAYKRVVRGLPRRPGFRLFVEVWNEPNLNAEWSGRPNPYQYGRFFLDVSRAIRSLGYEEVKILNAGMGPDTGDYPNFLETMLQAYPQLLTDNGGKPAFDYWAAHPYPQNHPPEYNYHNGSLYTTSSIDSYWHQLNILGRYGANVGTPQRPGAIRVVITETGYELGNNIYGFEGYPRIDESNRADYVRRAFRDYWSKWPEVVAVAPFQICDPYGNWSSWDWVYPDSGTNADGSPSKVHPQYSAVASLPKATQTLTLKLAARAGPSRGTFPLTAWVNVDGVKVAEVSGAAPVTVTGDTFAPVSVQVKTGKLKSGDAGSLAGKDAAYFVVAAKPLDSRWASIYVSSYQVPKGLPVTGLALDYAGYSTLGGTLHVLHLWDWQAGGWVKVAQFYGGVKGVQRAQLAPGSASRFVNTAGEVRVRVRTFNSGWFRLHSDMLQVVVGS